MGTGYASAFDDLLASGRRELEEMTGGGSEPRRDEERPVESKAAEPPRSGGGKVRQGSVRGIPFKVRLR